MMNFGKKGIKNMQYDKNSKVIQMKIASRKFTEIANIIEELEQSIKWLDEQIISYDKSIDEEQSSENSWLWRDQLDNYARKDAILDIIEYLSKFK